jgi:predicted small metal-binding protein
MTSRQRPAGEPASGGGVRVIQCPCGYVVRAATEDDLVSRAMTHARESHQMDLTREQALAMARPA